MAAAEMDTEPKTEDELLEESLAQAEKEHRERESVLERERKKRRLEELTLAKRLTTELGPRGRDFEIINTEFGVFAVKTPDPLKSKIYLDKANDDDGQEDERTHQFAVACLVYPAAKDFNAVASVRTGITALCVRAALILSAQLEKKEMGK